MGEVTLKTPMETLKDGILAEDNLDELNNMIDIFNLNIKKRDIVRNSKLSEIQDKVVDQIYERVDKRADEFSNADLLQYHKIINDTLAKSSNNLDEVRVPTIQVNQQVNIDSSANLSRESRERILSVVDSILNVEPNFEIIEEEELEVDGGLQSEEESK